MNLVNKFYKWLTGPVSISHLANEAWSFTKVETSVRYFYYVLLFLAAVNFQWWDDVSNRQNFVPLWPIFWANGMEYARVIVIVQFTHLITAFVGAIFYRHRWARFLVFVGISQFHGLESSFGQPNHQWYLFLFVSLFFIFLTDVWKKGAGYNDKKNFLLVFFSAQAITLLTYSMSGLGKFIGAYYQYSIGQIHGFSPQAFAYQIADWLPKIQANPVLGSFIINNPLVGWPLYAGIHFIMLFSVFALFRPALHKFWASSLIMFHIGAYAAMNISFSPPIMLLILLFFNSPFTYPGSSLRSWLFAKPVLK